MYVSRKPVRWDLFDLYPYPPNTVWSDSPGIYIFAAPRGLLGHQAIYIGQCNSFRMRLAWHEKWAEAQRLGARSVHAMVVDRQLDRDWIERHLIETFRPPLNKQLVPAA